MDKVIHTGIFTLAGILLVWAYGKDRKLFNFLLIYGIAIECAQGLTGYRSFDILDLLANAAGLFISRLVVHLKPTENQISEAG